MEDKCLWSIKSQHGTNTKREKEGKACKKKNKPRKKNKIVWTEYIYDTRKTKKKTKQGKAENILASTSHFRHSK